MGALAYTWDKSASAVCHVYLIRLKIVTLLRFKKMRTIAIGDIHGCAEALVAIIGAISPQPDDLIVPLGDYVDRGPDSRRVLDVLIELQARCRLKPLLGNHEWLMLQSLRDGGQTSFWMQCGGRQTLESYGGRLDDVPQEHIDFLGLLRRFYQTPGHIFVHANYEPDVDLESLEDLPLLWQHLSLIVPPPHKSGKTVVVGHTPQRTGQILDLGHIICIDTYCVGGGWLTAFDVDSGQTWQANCQGKMRET